MCAAKAAYVGRVLPEGRLILLHNIPCPPDVPQAGYHFHGVIWHCYYFLGSAMCYARLCPQVGWGWAKKALQQHTLSCQRVQSCSCSIAQALQRFSSAENRLQVLLNLSLEKESLRWPGADLPALCCLASAPSAAAAQEDRGRYGAGMGPPCVPAGCAPGGPS